MQAKTTKKIVLRLACQQCKAVHMHAIKVCPSAAYFWAHRACFARTLCSRTLMYMRHHWLFALRRGVSTLRLVVTARRSLLYTRRSNCCLVKACWHKNTPVWPPYAVYRSHNLKGTSCLCHLAQYTASFTGSVACVRVPPVPQALASA